MRKSDIRTQKPPPDLDIKIRRAREAIVNQEPRFLKCPYCKHNSLAVYNDARGHVESKCSKCGQITVFDVVNMRRTPTLMPVYC